MIHRIFDLSLQQKIPLWGAILILFSTLSVSGVLMYRAYVDLKDALITSSVGLGQTLSNTLAPPLLRDDTWRAFEIIRAPFLNEARNTVIRPDTILVVSPENKVVVSSRPEAFPLLDELDQFKSDFAPFSTPDVVFSIREPRIFETNEPGFIYVALPIEDGDLFMGVLILRHPKQVLLESFQKTATGGALFGFIVLAILLPINWYWGQRMAVPLITLARHMKNMGSAPPETLESGLYSYNDEMGQMFEAYNAMVETLKEKAILEKEMVASERLAAMGRLTAGIAHEVNNPLAGMLTALDTIKRRGGLDERTQKTMGLLERGLVQIRETVGALLVEARPSKRWIEAGDFEDIHTLVQHTLKTKQVDFQLETDIPGQLPYPAGAIRQVSLNLIQNAIEAASHASNGWVHACACKTSDGFSIKVTNNGNPIPVDRFEHLFEPFVSYQNGGHGLGLWVTYQLVSQLNGHIDVRNEQDTVEFCVLLPYPKDKLNS